MNPRPPEPHSGALPDCATSRQTGVPTNYMVAGPRDPPTASRSNCDGEPADRVRRCLRRRTRRRRLATPFRCATGLRYVPWSGGKYTPKAGRTARKGRQQKDGKKKATGMRWPVTEGTTRDRAGSKCRFSDTRRAAASAATSGPSMSWSGTTNRLLRGRAPRRDTPPLLTPPTHPRHVVSLAVLCLPSCSSRLVFADLSCRLAFAVLYLPSCSCRPVLPPWRPPPGTTPVLTARIGRGESRPPQSQLLIPQHPTLAPDTTNPLVRPLH